MEIKILIVDDDTNRIEYLVQTFEAEGIQVTCCDNIPDATQAFTKRPPSAVVLNNSLPHAQDIGFPIFANIRVFNNTRLMALIPDSYDGKRRAQMRTAGADILLHLPPDHEEYVAAIGALLRQWKGGEWQHLQDSEGYVVHGKLLIDRPHRRVMVGEEQIKLTAKEFDILYLLSSHPGMVFSKDKIYETVWHEEFPYGCRSVIDHIAAIRSKIGKRPDGLSYIETVHSVGYTFREI